MRLEVDADQNICESCESICHIFGSTPTASSSPTHNRYKPDQSIAQNVLRPVFLPKKHDYNYHTDTFAFHFCDHIFEPVLVHIEDIFCLIFFIADIISSSPTF
jgi:hypothetical protein